MIFHENCLLADDSHEISYLISFKNWGRCSKICRAVVISALRVQFSFWKFSEISNTIPESMFMSLLGSRLSVSGLPRRLVTGRDSNDSALLALRILRLFQC